jgi:hypothetical protein
MEVNDLLMVEPLGFIREWKSIDNSIWPRRGSKYGQISNETLTRIGYNGKYIISSDLIR